MSRDRMTPSLKTVKLATLISALSLTGPVGSTFAQLPVAEEASSSVSNFTSADLEFFEKKVRPILVSRCYECHSVKSKALKGGLRLDSRHAAVEGGDTGPAVVPGNLDESLLVDAVRYGETYQMPPKSKLPDAEIETLVDWVRRGAPWPVEAAPTANLADEAFNFSQRLEDHWCWQAIKQPVLPTTEDKSWAATDIDKFILAKLESADLRPADPAEKATLLRRAYFDLIGLPPTVEQLQAFLQDESPAAFENVVDELLDSPQFAERWSRHWLDLVRYAESRGHEFDYDTPNAFQYRDYVIRALDRDVPYDQFLTEHLAGDLLQAPRRHPEDGFNESVLGTGFWFLGEWVHSPVDIRKDETDRYDNMIDVFSKTFLGLTVACARCHDHKFDAIYQEDYYALAGYLQSSAYRQVRFETELDHAQVQRDLDDLNARFAAKFWTDFQNEWESNSGDLENYLEAARSLQGRVAFVDKPSSDVVVADFEDGSLAGWEQTGEAFQGGPVRLEEIADYQGDTGATGKFTINSHNRRGKTEVEHNDRWTGTLTSPPFELSRDSITMLVGGGAHKDKTCVDLWVDGKRVLTATGRSSNKMSPVHWDVRPWRGKTATLRVVDQVTGGWGNISVDQVTLTNARSASVATIHDLSKASIAEIDAESERRQLDSERLKHWVIHLLKTSGPEHAKELLHHFATQSKRAATPAAIAAEAAFRPSFQYKFDAKLMVDGVSFGSNAVQAGATILGDQRDSPLEGVSTLPHARRRAFWNPLRLAGGASKDVGRIAKWDRAGKTVRTPTFGQTADETLYYLVRGKGLAFAVVTSHRMLNGPLHGSVLKEFDTNGKLQWIAHDLRRYDGNDLHVEFVAVDESPLEVYEVRLQESPPSLPASNVDLFNAIAAVSDDSKSIAGLMKTAWQGSSAADHEFQNWVVQNAELFVSNKTREQWNASEYWAERKELAARIRPESKTAMAMWDGSGRDELLLIRGNHKTPGEAATRRNLSAFRGGENEASQQSNGSGRLDLAAELTTIDNPLTARVAANRIWGHLTGRGIVASTDNFGVLGQRPTHPELLDHLAIRFVEQGWSTKKLIREIMLTKTYQMASHGNSAAVAKDPTNQLLHSMRIRRLEGEAIRDAILSLSARLDQTMYGPSVPVYLTPFMQGRGRPGAGPLDGNGRRSVYISVRRNFLSPMMLAFDTPQPFNTVGNRAVSNVPAQALIMLNDPFVSQQAKLWADAAIKAVPDSADARLDRLFQQAMSRPARPAEKELLRQFIADVASERGVAADATLSNVELWTEVCHTLFNMKEFMFVF
jgi:hypothetical protein